jgi:hypothetical protein
VLFLLAVSYASGREEVTFDYGWKHKLGDPATAVPVLTTAASDTTFTNISGSNCTQLAWSQLGRASVSDCKGACSSTLGCKAWVFTYSNRPRFPACFIHDGTLGDNPVCAKQVPIDPKHRITVYEAGFRTVVPPPIQKRAGVSWKEPLYDDSSWQSIDVPHDFIIAGDGDDTGNPDYPYSASANVDHGYLPRDKAGWYRKHFMLPARWGETKQSAGGATWLHFEGVFQSAEIFLNGKFLLRHTSGYLGFDVELHTAPIVHYGAGAENVLAVRVDASFGSGHWYEGGGLQRQVYLLHTDTTTRFATGGLFAQGPGSNVSAALASIVPTAEVISSVSNTASTVDISRCNGTVAVEVRYTLVDPNGTIVANASTAPTAVGGLITLDGAMLTVTSPKLWSVRDPQLYTLRVELLDSNADAIRALDNLTVSIGLRSIDWSGKHFKLNGHDVHIRGFSHHSDFGAVGGAVPDRLNVFRAHALRSVGGNWWRTSHNPYRPALYDILDRVGVLCWNENRDFNQLNTEDMETLVRRDRNHASVAIWSACNEFECYVSGPANDTGRLMQQATKKWDTTRPFSANQVPTTPGDSQNRDWLTYLAGHLDVEGFSHGFIGRSGAAAIHDAYPEKNFISSECCSCQTQRGEDWGGGPDAVLAQSLKTAECMQRCMNLSYPKYTDPSPEVGIISGTSGVWTLFDYGGEPGDWPHVSSSFGQFDYAGFAKSASFWYRAIWLAATDAKNDYGRPPLPAAHVVRISQSWQAPLPYAPQNAPLHAPLHTPLHARTARAIAAVANCTSRLNVSSANRKCVGLKSFKAETEDACAAKCCADTQCTVYQFCAAGKYCDGEAKGKSGAECYMGSIDGCSSDIRKGWVGMSGGVGPSPTPSPGPTPPGPSPTPKPGPAPTPSTVPVQVFSDLPVIELFLNGASQGTSPCVPSGFASFSLKGYEAGNLTAVGLSKDSPQVLASHTLVTAGAAVEIVLSVDVPSVMTGTGRALVLDGHDTGMVRAALVDEDGRTADASNLVTFAVESGPGRVSGVHNGSPSSHEPQVAKQRHAYHGLARAAIKVTRDTMSSAALASEIEVSSGDAIETVALGEYSGAMQIIVTASSPGLKPGRVAIKVSSDRADAPLEVAGLNLRGQLAFE